MPIPRQWRRARTSGGLLVVTAHTCGALDGRANGREAAVAALPCRNSNNSISAPLLTASPTDRKRAFALRRNVDGFLAHFGREHTLFFTLTDAHGRHPRVFAKRWDSWKTNCGDWMAGYLKVLEPQRNGRPHYHNLAAVEWDTRPDSFDWQAFDGAAEAYDRKDWVTFRAMRSRYVNSAAPELRALWSQTRAQMPAYGIGRCEVLPVRKLGAISEYVGKYLEKGSNFRPADWRGVRRTELDRTTSREWRRAGLAFSWVSPGAKVWRRRVREMALALGCPNDGDLSHVSKKLGARWAYRLRGAMMTASASEWHETLLALRISYDPRQYQVIPDNGANSAW